MIEKEISGVKRGFELGTYTFKLIAEHTGERDVQKVIQRLSIADLPFIVSVGFCCAKTYDLRIAKKDKIDYTEEDVYDWVDEIGFSLFSDEVIAPLLQVYAEKNLRAPQIVGRNQNQ
jgi:hypothetical protein